MNSTLGYALRSPQQRSATCRRSATPKELFLHELGDILYVERKLANDALPKLIGEVTDDEFKSGLEKHLKETSKHVTNVEQVFEIFGEEPHAEQCVGFEGLKKEHDEMIEKASSSLVDSSISARPRAPRTTRSQPMRVFAVWRRHSARTTR